MRIFITGCKGQLGQALNTALAGEDLTGCDLPELDITDRVAIGKAIADFAPHVVIHAAAWTDVDGCARDPQRAYLINALGTQSVALACARIGAPMVYISTNEVFDGAATEPYREWDSPNPINPYGRSKAAGEWFVRHLLTRFYIVRTAWLYAPGGRNFPHRILQLAEEKGALRVVVDEVGNPTYAPDLAAALAALIYTEAYGVYHLTNTGYCSRYDFAREILRRAGREQVPVEPIALEEFRRDSTPPRFAPLTNTAAAALGITLRPWQEALAEFLDQRIMTNDQWSTAQLSNQQPATSNEQPATRNPPLVSIVIPNLNGAHHLPVCLESLRRQTFRDFETIVVDNGSTDGSLDLLAQNFPEVRALALGQNRGFAGACNAGIRAARGEFVVLLNNDTETDPHWLEEVVGAFQRHPEAGIVASKMLLFDRRDTFHTAGDFYRVDGIPGNRGVWRKDDGQYDTEEYVFSACGGSAAYRREMLNRIGLLDEDFFYSCEDVDLAWRAQLAGWRCIYTPRAVVYHKLSATGGGVTASFHDGRNYIYLLVKDYPGDLWRVYWRSILRAQLRLAWEAVQAWRGTAARARLRGMLAGLLSIPRMLHKRRTVQRTRRVSRTDLESVLAGVDESP